MRLYKEANRFGTIVHNASNLTLEPITSDTIKIGHSKHDLFKTHIKSIKSMTQNEYDIFSAMWDLLPDLISELEYVTLMTYIENKIAA